MSDCARFFSMEFFVNQVVVKKAFDPLADSRL